MEQIRLGDQIIRYDRERTVNAYSAIKSGDCEECGCLNCRNFAAQRKTVYPDEFRLLLDQLGIDPEKEAEVCGYGPEVSMMVYEGRFYFAGELMEPGERMTDAGSGFQYYFTDGNRLPDAKADFGNNVLAVEFSTKAPWVIVEQPS
jgi:hypothetical protein